MFSDLSWFIFPSPVGEQDWGEEEDLPTLQNDSAKTSNGRYLRVLPSDIVLFFSALTPPPSTRRFGKLKKK